QLSFAKYTLTSETPTPPRPAFLHVLAALANQTQRVRKSQAARGGQARLFTQAVTSYKIWRDALLPKHRESRHGDGEQRGLRIGGQLQLVFRTLETEAGNRKAQRLVGFFEDAPRGRIGLPQTLPHSRRLRALAGKEKCNRVRQA